ncbi:serine dehydratase subunit alpha family protein [bacterium]|nr:serine dehydratase subunit alpha family protein [bacterium]
MNADKQTVDKIISILNEEMVPAEGCTEPIAIAYVAAKARELLGKTPDKVKIYVSGNIIKNVKSVVVPNSGGMIGIEVSAAMGIVAGKVQKGLMVISQVNDADMVKVREFLNSCQIEVIHEKNDIKLYVRIELICKNENVIVEIKHLHTNITSIVKNGKEIINRPCSDADFNSPLTDRNILSIELIYNLAKTIDLELIKPLFKKVICMNTTIAEEGLRESYGVNIGSCIVKNIDLGVYGDDRRNRCASYAAAGSDARMSGCPLPVMTTSGSGNQGMTASLPIIKFCQLKEIGEEQMIRALFISHLSTIHIKTNVGRLSAYCGAMCASAGVSGALTFLIGGNFQAVASAIINTLGNISGVICDGAKASCAMKIATGVYAAFDSATLAHYHKVLHGGEGIVGSDVEETIMNIGELAKTGMQTTDEVILEIMTK